jgi:hypothetical protein
MGWFVCALRPRQEHGGTGAVHVALAELNAQAVGADAAGIVAEAVKGDATMSRKSLKQSRQGNVHLNNPAQKMPCTASRVGATARSLMQAIS